MVDEFDSTDMADEALASVARVDADGGIGDAVRGGCRFAADLKGRMIEQIGLD